MFLKNSVRRFYLLTNGVYFSVKVYAEGRRIKCFFRRILLFINERCLFLQDQEEIRVFLFLQPRIFFRDAKFGVKVYIGGRRLCGVETESIVDKFYLERVVQRENQEEGSLT